MKVELELTTEQFQNLENDLENLLANLTEKQQIELLRGYINQQLKDIEYSNGNYYDNKQLTKFGQALINGLQNKIEEVISEEIIHKEKLKERLDKIADNISKNLEQIINEAIIRYVINNVFVRQQEVINMTNNMLNEHLQQYHSHFEI